MTTTTVTIQIGNSDDKLTQTRWHAFVAEIEQTCTCVMEKMHFNGGSPSSARWQNHCFVIEVSMKEQEWYLDDLRRRLGTLRLPLKDHPFWAILDAELENDGG